MVLAICTTTCVHFHTFILVVTYVALTELQKRSRFSIEIMSHYYLGKYYSKPVDQLILKMCIGTIGMILDKKVDQLFISLNTCQLLDSFCLDIPLE